MIKNKPSQEAPELPADWWKDGKLLTGVILVVASIAIGFYGKSLLGVFIVNWVNKLYTPFYLLTGLSVYAFSWIVFFLGIFLVGWETIKIIRNKIRHEVRKKVRETYDMTKELSKKSYHGTKALHKIGMDKISKTLKTSVGVLASQKRNRK